jgi:hypothetical protein
MHEKLNEAYELADSIRYSNDVRLPFQSIEDQQTEQINRRFSHSGLKITKSLTPDLFEVFQKVFSHLKINSDSINAYVYSSPETQATCFANNRQECVVWITSSLINLMTKEELAFVIGHELGHFILGHNIEKRLDDESEEYLIKCRAQEISVDRVGLVSCGSLNIGVQALMKLISGLDEEFLRFDVGSFLNQIKNQRGDTIMCEGSSSTHPSLVMRCRALLWFSMSDVYLKTHGDSGGEKLSKIDQLITTDSEKYVDGPARKRIKEAKEDLIMWLAALASVRDGIMDKTDQKAIKNLVGDEMLKKLLNLYSDQSRSEVFNTTHEKLIEALNHYKKVAPMDFQLNFCTLQDKLGADFNQPDFSKYVLNLIQD